MTKTDLIYIVVHVLIFLAAYAGVMSSTHVAGWFDWTSLEAGLVAVLGGQTTFHLASSTAGK